MATFGIAQASLEWPEWGRKATILEVKLDDLFCEAGRLLLDVRGDIKAVVTLYRRSRDARSSTSK